MSRLYRFLARLGRLPLTMVVNSRRSRYLPYVTLVIFLAILVLSVNCLKRSDACFSAVARVKRHIFQNDVQQPVKCPWKFFIKNYPQSELMYLDELKSTRSPYTIHKTESSINKVLNRDTMSLTTSQSLKSKKRVNGKVSRGKRKIPETRSRNRLLKFDLNNTERNNCLPIFPRVVLYNRIFKTGSTSLSSFFENCSRRLNYTLMREDWANEDIKSHQVVKRVVKSAKDAGKRRHLAVAHFYFRANLKLPVNHTYINVVREPIERFISHYHYARSPKRWPKRLRRLKKHGHFNETIEQCLEHEHEGCTWNTMTRFFCGPEAICKTGSREALERAKYNMAHHYASVGTSENLDDFVRMLSKRLPGFVANQPASVPKLFTTKSKGVIKKPLISERVMTKIRNANKADIELYHFARTLFNRQAKQCGVEIKR